MQFLVCVLSLLSGQRPSQRAGIQRSRHGGGVAAGRSTAQAGRATSRCLASGSIQFFKFSVPARPPAPPIRNGCFGP